MAIASRIAPAGPPRASRDRKLWSGISLWVTPKQAKKNLACLCHRSTDSASNTEQKAEVSHEPK